jgi:hypothetical protein
MPDISMCKGGKCPKKGKCYRYLATPDEHWQSYISTPYVEGEECAYFWEISACQLEQEKRAAELLEDCF